MSSQGKLTENPLSGKLLQKLHVFTGFKSKAAFVLAESKWVPEEAGPLFDLLLVVGIFLSKKL